MLNSGQNERSLLIIVSYVIGFVTAFILYGVNAHFDNQRIANAAVNNTSLAEGKSAKAHKSTESQLSITSTDAKITREKAPTYLDSYDKKFSFFCTKNNTDLTNIQDTTDACQAFIRVNQTEEIKPLTIDGEILTLAPDLLEIVHWSQTANYLQIGSDIRSESYLEPWILGDIALEE